MKHFHIISGLLAALGLLVLSACGGGAANPTADAAPVYTQIAMTALAFQTQTALVKPTDTITPTPSPTLEVTNTPLPTDTLLPGTPSATPASPTTVTTPKSTSQASCDNMQYVADVSYPDGEVVYPGTNMKKTWTVKNIGPCAWTKDYGLVFGWGGTGTDWNSVGFVHLTRAVSVGDTIDISVSLIAPKAKGTYGAYFVMQNDKGVNFPSSSLTIFITVQ